MSVADEVRNLIFGLLTVATLRGARAQQSKKVHRIAVAFPAGQVDAFTDTSDEPLIKAFFGELHRLGYFEGENLLIERYSGEGRTNYSDLVRDVVRRDPDLIVAINTPLVLDLKAATTTIHPRQPQSRWQTNSRLVPPGPASGLP